MTESQQEKRLVLGVIGEDPHVLGVTILASVLEKAGFKVVNLGVLCSQEDFVRAAVEHKADAVLVSSLYGQARFDCPGLREKLTAAGLKDILLYIGGNVLTHAGDSFEEACKYFKDIGFDRVFPPGTNPESIIPTMKEDLKAGVRQFIGKQ